MTHEELLEAQASTPDAIVWFKVEPPGAYDYAEIGGEIYVPTVRPAYPHDWPEWQVRRDG